MSKRILTSALILILPIVLCGQDVVEKIEINGNVRIPRKTILHYLFVQEGNTFDKKLLRKNFEVLWSTGFFSDIKIEEEQGTKGKILKIKVEENPFITKITYKSDKNLKKKEIIAWLREKGEYLSPHSFCSSPRLKKIKKSIEELLLEKGFHSGEVDIVMNEKMNNAHDMVIHINPGERTRIGEVVCRGDLKLPEPVLLGAMQENKKHRIESWIAGKDIFKQIKIDEDLARIKRKLHEHGYMSAVVGKPRIEEISKRAIFSKTQKMKKITIPVYAGPQYFVGRIEFRGNKAVSTETLEKLVGLKKGHVYRVKVRDACMENILTLYRQKGYLYAQITPSETLDNEKMQINVRCEIFEGEVTYLNKLEFRGNSFVKDKIMRKKMLIHETDIFDFQLFEESLLKINQLGIVRLEKEPEIKSDPTDPTQVDVVLDIKEKLKNNYYFSGGYSGSGGIYVVLDYAAINLLGKGEILRFTFEKGRKIKNYLFDLSEPYLLNYPVNFGLNVYYRDNFLPDLFERRGIGANVIFGTKIKGYWRANLTYGYENVAIELPELQREGETDFDPIYLTLFGLGDHILSSTIISIFYSNLEMPSFPFRRNLFSASCKLAGSFLGGDIALVKPRFVWSYFHPLFRNHKVGFYVDYQFIKTLKDSPLPFWERFYLGGDRSIRGYDFYSIGPTSEQGTNIGGEKAFVFNAEYILPVYGPFYAVFFYDMGNAYRADQRISLKSIYSSTGLEMRIFHPPLPIPVRIIFAYNNRIIGPQDSHFSVRLTVGTRF